MNIAQRLADRLESRWLTPSYSGWLLGSLTLFFFIAATNTLSGWLYVLSGIGTALLAIAAVLPERNLRGLQIRRPAIAPVSVGEPLAIALELENSTRQPKALLQLQDHLAATLGQPVTQAIELLPPQRSHTWRYQQPTQQRGIYRWQTVQLRTAAPLGLFWCRRSRSVPARAIVYPTVLPLVQCPLVDEMGRDASVQFNSDRRAQGASEGVTRSLRPYRWGDPTRLVHWRSSARYGELRVRELELFTGGQELVICLDSAADWRSDSFEQAVIAAASIYFYAGQRQFSVRLWTSGLGLVQGSEAVLETLAAVHAQETAQAELPRVPIVWLTVNLDRALPLGSRWVVWPRSANLNATPDTTGIVNTTGIMNTTGIVINDDQPLQQQLQQMRE